MTLTRITAEDVLRPGSRWRDCEIWDGLPLVREPSGGRAEVLGARLMARLTMHVTEQGLGWTFQSSQGFLLARNPDRLLAPDGAYVSRERLPTVPVVGFIELAPDFVLEVRSPTDSWEAVIEKGTVWVVYGTSVVWCVDPLAERLVILRPGQHPHILDPQDVADAGPVLPGFALSVADVFGGLDP